MTRISSSVGLITGIPIEETVKKLMAVSGQPRDILKSRTDGLKQQQLALDTMGSRLLSFQFAVNKLKTTSVFQTREVTSSKKDVLEAALPVSGTANPGSYLVRPVQAASAQQLVSQRFESAAEALGSGLLSFRFGGHVDQGISLEQLNGGAGVQRGKIKIVDRSGASATIDLSFARTVDDVINAINDNSDVAVKASAQGDTFVLTDNSGGSGNLHVQEIGSGTTAASLGLGNINDAADQATGDDVFRLHTGTKLTTLNDGNGVAISKEGIADLEVTLSDGSTLSIDLHDVATLGDVVSQINAKDSAKLSAAISADGRRLELNDLTGGAGPFKIESGVVTNTAEDLGIATEVTGQATITGQRLVSGLRDSLVSRLNGGQGYGGLGEITITDRDGTPDTIDLSSAETLGDIFQLINDSSVEVSASINSARSGISIVDVSGGSGNLVIANADSTDSATSLGIAIDAAVESVNSGTLHRQTLGEATLLSSLNGGAGVTLGDLRITNSAGVSKTADLDAVGPNKPTTVGDVINTINALNHGITARINDAGDGIILVDTEGGAKPLAVKDLGGNLAASLNLTRTSETVDINGTPTKVIDGSSSYEIDLEDLEVDNNGISLASLNNGKGVAAGDFVITDSLGRSIAIDLNGADESVATVGQLIDLINQKGASATGGFGVTARVNDAGTGIFLEDTAGGSEKLTVRDVNSTTAADLKLTGAVSTTGEKQTINGAGAFTASNATASGLNALASRINDLKAGVTASTVYDGFGYRLSLTVDKTGSTNNLLLDASEAGFTFEETSKAQDALLLYGNLSNPGAGILLSSADGHFEGAVGGADVTVKGASDTPVTVTVRQTNTALVTAVKDMVASYNALRTDLGKLTAFDSEAATVGLLFGSNEALQIDSRLSLALTSRYFGDTDFRSLEQIGLSVTEDGTLELNQVRLEAAFENDPEGVESFLTNAESGVAVKISATIDRLAGTETSMLAARSEALQSSIKANEDRLTRFEEQLERQQDRLYLQFYQLESIIASMQTSLTAIQNLQPIPPLS